MGRVIAFHIPDGFKPRVKVKEVAQREAGKVIEFRPAEARSQPDKPVENAASLRRDTYTKNGA